MFFFDEAHMLFKDAPKALLERVEQVLHLIRSKGVGIYFVTQDPLDIPDTVSRQLGTRIQHTLHAYMPAEQKAVAQTFRGNPTIDIERAIMQLGIGEALVSTLDQNGQSSMVELTWVRPPNSRVGPITDAERNAVINASPVEYDAGVKRDSAYEILQKRTGWLVDAEATLVAAEQGDADAQVNLGFMYKSGHGGPRDAAEAVQWFRRAANQGNAEAQDNLRAWASDARRW